MKTFKATYECNRLNGKELKPGVYTVPAKPQKPDTKNPLVGFKI